MQQVFIVFIVFIIFIAGNVINVVLARLAYAFKLSRFLQINYSSFEKLPAN